nr:hypothetical protein [Rhizobium laguerreae]
MTTEACDHGAVPAWLGCAHLADLPQMRWRLVDQAVRNGDGDVEVGEMVSRIGAFAVFQRNLEGGLLPDVFQRVEMAVLQPFKAKVASSLVIGLGARRGCPDRPCELIED